MAWVNVLPGRPESLRHGYTLDDVERLAASAVKANPTMACDVQDRYEEAWSAVVECLYAAEQPPPEHELIAAGAAAIRDLVRLDHRSRGVVEADAWSGGAHAPNFVRFWTGLSARAPSPEAKVVERVAVLQILAALTPARREALLALAAHDGDRDAAADAQGLSYGTSNTRIIDARRQCLELWHEGEVPSKIWGHDRAGGRGGGYRQALAALRQRTGTSFRRRRRPAEDLLPVEEGLRVGWLTVLEPRRRGMTRILCRCDCGREKQVIIANLRNGNTRSCGCPGGRAAAAQWRRSVDPAVGPYARVASSQRAMDRRAGGGR